MTEADLQREIAAWLTERGCIVTRLGVGGSRAHARVQGQTKGVADLLVCLPGGKYAAIEVKMPKNGPSEDQLAFLHAVRNLGGIALVAYSVADLEPLGLDA